jgi:hypothetical protein
MLSTAETILKHLVITRMQNLKRNRNVCKNVYSGTNCLGLKIYSTSYKYKSILGSLRKYSFFMTLTMEYLVSVRQLILTTADLYVIIS